MPAAATELPRGRSAPREVAPQRAMTASVHQTEDLLFSILLQVIVMIGAARIGNRILRRLGQPGVVGEIMAGLLARALATGPFPAGDLARPLRRARLDPHRHHQPDRPDLPDVPDRHGFRVCPSQEPSQPPRRRRGHVRLGQRAARRWAYSSAVPPPPRWPPASILWSTACSAAWAWRSRPCRSSGASCASTGSRAPRWAWSPSPRRLSTM